MTIYSNIIKIKAVLLSAAVLFGVSSMESAYAQGANETVKATHGSWKILCQTPPETGQEVCVMEQIAMNDDNAPLVNMRLRKLTGQQDKDGNNIPAVAQIIVPLNVFLPAGLGVKIDEGEIRGAPYERCTSSGCVVRAPISTEMLNDLQNGGTAQILMVVEPGNSVPATLSLSGFSAAFGGI